MKRNVAFDAAAIFFDGIGTRYRVRIDKVLGMVHGFVHYPKFCILPVGSPMV